MNDTTTSRKKNPDTRTLDELQKAQKTTKAAFLKAKKELETSIKERETLNKNIERLTGEVAAKKSDYKTLSKLVTDKELE